jgi:hypothetical protein
VITRHTHTLVGRFCCLFQYACAYVHMARVHITEMQITTSHIRKETTPMMC